MLDRFFHIALSYYSSQYEFIRWWIILNVLMEIVEKCKKVKHILMVSRIFFSFFFLFFLFPIIFFSEKEAYLVIFCSLSSSEKIFFFRWFFYAKSNGKWKIFDCYFSPFLFCIFIGLFSWRNFQQIFNVFFFTLRISFTFVSVGFPVVLVLTVPHFSCMSLETLIWNRKSYSNMLLSIPDGLKGNLFKEFSINFVFVHSLLLWSIFHWHCINTFVGNIFLWSHMVFLCVKMVQVKNKIKSFSP